MSEKVKEQRAFENLEKIKKDLNAATTNLNDIAKSKAVCEFLVNTNNIKIVDNSPVKENVKPVELSLTGDLIPVIFQPILKMLVEKRESWIATKEKILKDFEGELFGNNIGE